MHQDQGEHDTNSLQLNSVEYGLLVAPALAAAAEVAAERGDPHLFNDMASMLALMWMVSGLASAYRQAVPESQWSSPKPALEAAPLGACALVFTESDLDQSAVDECLSSLIRAGQMLEAEGVHEAGKEGIAASWAALQNDEHESAIASLQAAARAIAVAIDGWEAQRGNGGA
jgi:hypothetical protein